MAKVEKNVRMLDFVYSFAKHGGAQGVIALGKLPAGSVLLGGTLRIIDPIVTPTSSGAAAIEIGYGEEPSGISAGAGVDSGQFDVGFAHEGTAAAAIQLPTETSVFVTISGANLTAGEFAVRLGVI